MGSRSGGEYICGDGGGLNFCVEDREAKAALPPRLEIQFAPSDPKESLPEGSRRLRGQASGDGTLLTAWIDTWTDGKWKEEPKGNLPALAMVRGDVLEGRVPWDLVGMGKVKEVFFRVRLEAAGDFGEDARRGMLSDWDSWEIEGWE